MSGAALRYWRRHQGGPPLAVEVGQGGATRVHLPDPASKARLVDAVANASCEPDEELEVLGEPVRALNETARRRLLRRVAVVSPAIALISNLNAWENISLPAAYHGSPARSYVEGTAHRVLRAFGLEPNLVLAKLPEQLGAFHRLLVAFVRALVTEPELALIDGLDAGLSRDERTALMRFEAEYVQCKPAGTLVFVDSREGS